MDTREAMLRKFFLLIVVALPLAGCAMSGGDAADPLDELRATIDETVLDGSRAAPMLAAVDAMDAVLVESAQILAESARKERKLFRDYDSTPQDYRAFFAAARGERQRVQQQLVDIHLEIRSYATPGEWETIRPVQLVAVASRVDSLVNAAADRN